MEEAVEQQITTEEFERTPIPQSKLKGWKSFLGMYAGEHAAGTELVIGPLFLTAGVSAFDLLIGLLVGNFLAVASWRFITAPVATKMRLTLYYQLERICGRNLVTVYNLANGLLFCFLAGAMITVAATAVGIPFDMEMPQLTDAYPTGVTWVVVVLAVGAVISFVAAKGYDTVSKFANIIAPWMIIVFLVAGIVSTGRLGVNSFSDFWAIWGEGSDPFPGQIKFTFWHVVFFAWFCNAAMHVGMSDLTILRFAKKPSMGWASATGIYVGHYMAWIAACLLYAFYIRSAEAQAVIAAGGSPAVSPGPLTYDALGVAGLICVIVAGWTTANPTIYRAGLAFQAIIPKASRFKVTLATGAIATIAGLFPAFAMKLLDFVAVYGFILSPIGAIIFFDFYFSDKIGLQSAYAEKAKLKFNVAVLLAWLVSMAIFYYLSASQDIFLSFFTAPAWITCGVLFLAFSYMFQKKKSAQTV